MRWWRDLEGFPREFWVLCLATVVNRAGSMALPFLVLFLTQSKEFSGQAAGFAMTAYGIGSLIGAVISGRLVDRFSSRIIMVSSLTGTALLLAVVPMLQSYRAILVIAFLWAMVSEAFRPASMTVVASILPLSKHKVGYAINRLAINLGMSIGPLVGGWLTTVSYAALFYVDGATSLAAAVVLAIVPWTGTPLRTTAPAGFDPAKESPSHPLPGHPDRKLWFFLLALTPVIMVFFQFDAALPLYMVNELGLTEVHFGSLFVVNTVLIILLEVPLNLAMHAWPNRVTLPLGAILCGIGYGALIFCHNLPLIMLSVAVWTFSEMILMPIGTAYVASIAPPERRGRYMGWYMVTYSIAFSFGPWAGTAIMHAFGASALWAVCFGVCAGAAVLMRFVYDPGKGENQPPHKVLHEAAEPDDRFEDHFATSETKRLND